MGKLTYAPPLLAFGVIGLVATCFMANGAGQSSSASAAPARREEASRPIQTVSLPVASAEVPAAPASGPAPVNPAVDAPARAQACEAELARIVAANPLDFRRDGVDLTPRAKATAGEVALVARACPAMDIEIQAHTDKTGRRQNNLRLSKKRAEAVKKYLVELGLSPDTLTAVGFGPDRPVASNRTEAGRAQNRRIEFRVSPGE